MILTFHGRLGIMKPAVKVRLAKLENHNVKKEGWILEPDKFNELEGKIKKILSEYSLLKKQNQELKGLLKNTELELEGAKGRLIELNEERDAIRTKVDTLINLLQDVDITV